MRMATDPPEVPFQPLLSPAGAGGAMQRRVAPPMHASGARTSDTERPDPHEPAAPTDPVGRELQVAAARARRAQVLAERPAAPAADPAPGDGSRWPVVAALLLGLAVGVGTVVLARTLAYRDLPRPVAAAKAPAAALPAPAAPSASADAPAPVVPATPDGAGAVVPAEPSPAVREPALPNPVARVMPVLPPSDLGAEADQPAPPPPAAAETEAAVAPLPASSADGPLPAAPVTATVEDEAPQPMPRPASFQMPHKTAATVRHTAPTPAPDAGQGHQATNAPGSLGRAIAGINALTIGKAAEAMGLGGRVGPIVLDRKGVRLTPPPPDGSH